MEMCCQGAGVNVISDMVEKGLPFKEVFACINDNQIAIRVQQPILEDEESECDSPCDCLDPLPKTDPHTAEDKLNKSRTFTITQNADKNLKTEDSESEDQEKSPPSLPPPSLPPEDLEENPNIFVFKVRKRFHDDSEKCTLDVDFKFPRPWSKEMRDHFDRIYNVKANVVTEKNKTADENVTKKTGKQKNGKGKKGKKKK